MNKRELRISATLILSLLALVGTLVLLSNSTPALAQTGTGAIRVATTGSDTPGCGSAASPCRTVQYAVDQAQAGDGIWVAAGVYTGVQTRAGVTQTVYISKSLTLRGGYTTTTWTSSPISYPTTLDAEGQGRVFYIAGPATVTLEGLNVTGGATSSWADGAGLYADEVTLTISRCQVYSNTSGGYVGGLLIRDSVVALLDNIVYSNEADHTGGLYIRDSSSTLSGNTIRDNRATNSHVGGLDIRGGEATLTGNTISGNTADKSVGGLSLDSGVFTLTNNVIISNTADNSAGGVELDVGTFVLISNTISGNRAEGINQDTGNGGGLLLLSGDYTLSGNTINANYAEISGGGVCAQAPQFSDTNITMTGNTISGNEARAYGSVHYGGGGVYLDGCNATLSGNVIRENRVNGFTNDSGGGLNVQDSRITLIGNRVISNTSSDTGGGIYLYSNDAVTMTGNTVASNTADAHGGGLYLASHSWGTEIVTLTNNTVISNTSGGDGGGLYLSNNYTVTLIGNTLGYNVANDDGGGLYLGSSYESAILVHNTVVGNTANGGEGGGGLYLDSDASLVSNTVSGNAAGNGDGGGLYLDDDDISLAGNTVSGNRANGGNGGGLYLDQSDAGLSNNEIIRNTAGGSSTFDGGGGLYLYLSDAALSHNTVASNTADNNGGGLYLYSSAPMLNGNEVISNTADGSGVFDGGGGLYLYHSGAALMDNTVARNTAATDGGGVYLYESNGMLQGNHIAANTAGDDGGGVYLRGSDDAAVLDGNTVISNTAGDRGGGLSLDQSDATLRNNIVAENRATTAGSGIYVTDSAPHLLYTTLARNGNSDGSGIYVARVIGNNAVTLTNTILVSQTVGITVTAGNTATLEGVLWYGNGANTGGDGAIIATNDITGTPAFVDPAGGDYHLLPASTAVNNGVAYDYPLDIDGDYRPLAAPPDLGADEVLTTTPPCRARLNGTTVYSTVQEAVNAGAAPTDLIEVSGVCTDAITWNGSTYVAVLTRTLTLKGGYSTDFATWDPRTYPTLLNGLWQGGVLALDGAISPTVEYLTLLGGQGADGGGVWSDAAHPTLRHLEVTYNIAERGGGVMLQGPGGRLEYSRVAHNRASHGGGVYLLDSSGAVFSNTIQSNIATGDFGGGGGLYLESSDATVLSNTVGGNTTLGTTNGGGGGLYLDDSHDAILTGNTIQGNAAEEDGGGVYLDNSDNVSLSSNTVRGNTANDSGGGLYLFSSDGVGVDHNAVLSNTAMYGGGLRLYFSDNTSLSGNVIRGNAAGRDGGGVHIYSSNDAGLVNNVVVGNQIGASRNGSGIFVEASTPVYMLHTTIHDNSGGDGSGVHIADYYGSYSDVWMTNTIVTSQTVGVKLDSGNAAYLDSVLWAGNGTDTTGSVNVTNEYTGTPAFAADGYHLNGDSAAIDRGVSAGVTSDIDGEYRPYCAAPDLGADEYPQDIALTDVVINGPTTGLTDTLYTFTATVSPVSATLPVTYTWQATGQTEVIHSSGGLSDTVTFSWAVTGTKAVTVTGVNGCGVAFDVAQIVIGVNEPPVADAGADQTVSVGATVTLDGSGSTDPDGHLSLRYGWAQSGGPGVALSDPTAVAPTFTAPAVPAVLTFTLTVTDSLGLADPTPDETVVTVAACSALSGVAVAGPATATVGTAVVLTASVTPPTAALPVTYTWQATGQTEVIHSGGGLSDTATFSWAVTGTQAVTVTAVNRCGVIVTTRRTIAVEAAGQGERKVYLPLVLRGG